ncbi:oxidoreductase-like protein [Aureobasidium pullulans]|nr:oxidoreductase-like protein [Aureobasidium pullulans]
MANQAAWLDGFNQKFRVGPAPMPEIESHEIIVENYSFSINPIDWKVRDLGWLINTWPMVLGCDIAGVVTKVGSNVHRFNKGDRVIGHTVSLLANKAKNGSFQHFVAVEAAKAAKLPDSISFSDACVLPLALDTAATGLFNSSEKGYLGLQWPTLQAGQSDMKVVIYGASSSVGALAVQLATASGAYVIAIASRRNTDFCHSCGAKEVYDYNDASVVDDVVKAVKSASQPGFVGIYDAISNEDSYKITVPILEKLGSGNLATVLPGPDNMPSTSKSNYIEGINETVHVLWENFVGPALEQGKLKCVPSPHVVGNSLEDVEKGLYANKKGVSAKKIIIELKKE